MKYVWCFIIRSHFCSPITQKFSYFSYFFQKIYEFKLQIYKYWLFYTDLHLSHKLGLYTIQNNCFLLVNYIKQLCSLNKKSTNCLNVLTSSLSKAIYFVESQISKVLQAFSIFSKDFNFTFIHIMIIVHWAPSPQYQVLCTWNHATS